MRKPPKFEKKTMVYRGLVLETRHALVIAFEETDFVNRYLLRFPLGQFAIIREVCDDDEQGFDFMALKSSKMSVVSISEAAEFWNRCAVDEKLPFARAFPDLELIKKVA